MKVVRIIVGNLPTVYNSLMSIRYETKKTSELKPESVLRLFDKAGISKPDWTTERMQRALKGSAVVVTAWKESQLVGFANAITDFAWIAYLSQLAVDPEYQGKGIGKHLVELVLAELGEEVTLIVHSAEAASEFYLRAGFKSYSNVFRFPRKR
jgi:ribosomal protein S18 acetylase RimI-like enzyme